MQVKTNHTVENKIHRQYSTKEERLAHVRKWQESGLQVTEYCRQQNIPLTSFVGWRRATVTKPDQKFKPVITVPSVQATQIKSDNEGTVIEIIQGPAIKIRFINVADASLIVSIARELNKCS